MYLIYMFINLFARGGKWKTTLMLFILLNIYLTLAWYEYTNNFIGLGSPNQNYRVTVIVVQNIRCLPRIGWAINFSTLSLEYQSLKDTKKKNIINATLKKEKWFFCSHASCERSNPYMIYAKVLIKRKKKMYYCK